MPHPHQGSPMQALGGMWLTHLHRTSCTGLYRESRNRACPGCEWGQARRPFNHKRTKRYCRSTWSTPRRGKGAARLGSSRSWDHGRGRSFLLSWLAWAALSGSWAAAGGGRFSWPSLRGATSTYRVVAREQLRDPRIRTWYIVVEPVIKGLSRIARMLYSYSYVIARGPGVHDHGEVSWLAGENTIEVRRKQGAAAWGRMDLPCRYHKGNWATVNERHAHLHG